MKETKLFKSLLITLLFFSSFMLEAQTMISGVVKDATGEPIPFVSVLEKGTTNGVETDIDGNYEIKLKKTPSSITFSSIGFKSIERKVLTSESINIVMEEDSSVLEEVVVTGLATSVKRKNLANAVSTVTAKELVGNTGQSTVDGALYGKLTGVNITASSGAPGGGMAVRLRGISSINGNNQPLFIVDGVYINNIEIPSGLRLASGANRGNEENSANRLADIDPNDIENIEILKGASAAAIYGTRANAGVVIITTKRGKRGKTKISFGQDLGITKISNKLGMRNWNEANVKEAFGDEELIKYKKALANGGLINYEDEIYGETGIIKETKVGVSGGSGTTKFYVGSSYRDEEGIIKNTGYKRLSLKANIDHKISKVFDFSISSNYVRSSSSRSFTGNENEGGLSFGYNLAFTRPWVNLFPDSQGNYPSNPNASGNPIFVRNKAKNEDLNNRFIQGLKINTNIFKGEKNNIKLVTNFGLDYLSNRTDVYVPETHQAQISSGQKGFVAVGKNGFTNFNSQVIGVWRHNALNGDLNLTTQAGLTYLNQIGNLVLNTASNLIPNQTSLSQGNNQSISQNRFEIQEFGYFTQLEGNFKDQVIATLGYRLDKSTLNGDPNKLYGFPKASLAVNLNNFDFWKSKNINLLKFRTAYGETGSSAGYGSLFTTLNSTSIGGNGGSTVTGSKGDSKIKPETSSEFEVGVDAKFFDRVSFEATFYDRKVKDLILSRNLPTSSGFSVETTNLADLKNTGVELALDFEAFTGENFVWNSGIRYWHNRSEITRLDVPAFAQPGAGFGLGLGTYYIQKGKPVTQLAGTVDGKPTQIGNAEPDFQMSFNNQFTILKNIDLSFLVHWKSGGDNINLSTLLTDLGKTTPSLDTQAGKDRAGSGFVATRFIEPAGYVRLREAAVYYRLPKKFYSFLGLNGVKFGFSGKNLFTITDYTGYDPEVSTNGSAGLSSGIDVTPFPATKQYYFHLNVNF